MKRIIEWAQSPASVFNALSVMLVVGTILVLLYAAMK